VLNYSYWLCVRLYVRRIFRLAPGISGRTRKIRRASRRTHASDVATRDTSLNLMTCRCFGIRKLIKMIIMNSYVVRYSTNKRYLITLMHAIIASYSRVGHYEGRIESCYSKAMLVEGHPILLFETNYGARFFSILIPAGRTATFLDENWWKGSCSAGNVCDDGLSCGVQEY